MIKKFKYLSMGSELEKQTNIVVKQQRIKQGLWI